MEMVLCNLNIEVDDHILRCGSCQHMIGEWHVCIHNGGNLGMSTDAGR